MEPRITDQIRAACQAVALRSRYVRIDVGRLAEYDLFGRVHGGLHRDEPIGLGTAPLDDPVFRAALV